MSDSFAYSLVNGDGNDDNDVFSISGNQLLINESPDFETKDTYRIRLKSADIGNLIIEKSFSLSVIDLEEAPLIHIDYDFDVKNSGGISKNRKKGSNLNFFWKNEVKVKSKKKKKVFFSE